MHVLLLATTTGYQAAAFAAAARKIGATLTLGTDRCHVLDDPWGDGAVAVRFHQPEESAAILVSHARSTGVDAVVAIGDAPAIVAALVCRELGLPFHPPDAARACRDKFRSRQVLCAAGLPVPYFARLSADRAAEPPDGIAYPCVLKPGSMSASRGVIRADDADQFRAAFARIAALIKSPEVQVSKEETTGQILLEGFIEGREYAVEGILDHGRLKTLALFDKPDPLDGPYFEETIYVTPSRLDGTAQDAIIAAVDRAARALGLHHGPLHAEVRLNDRGPWILEIAARPIGGLCARALRFHEGEAGTDLSLEDVIVRHAAGGSIAEVRREDPASGVMMIPVPRAGILQAVGGLERALETPSVTEIEITAKLGQKLVPWPEGSSYLGFIFAKATHAEQVEQALREAHAKLDFAITPSLPVMRS